MRPEAASLGSSQPRPLGLQERLRGGGPGRRPSHPRRPGRAAPAPWESGPLAPRLRAAPAPARVKPRLPEPAAARQDERAGRAAPRPPAPGPWPEMPGEERGAAAWAPRRGAERGSGLDV